VEPAVLDQIDASFGMPGGTRSFNMTKPVDGSGINDDNYVPVEEN
jgi:hypothetical protein